MLLLRERRPPRGALASNVILTFRFPAESLITQPIALTTVGMSELANAGNRRFASSNVMRYPLERPLPPSGE